PARIAGIQHREVAQTAIHGDWVPAIPAGTTGLKELIGGKPEPQSRCVLLAHPLSSDEYARHSGFLAGIPSPRRALVERS
ncbi:MAG: hypothetical protein ACFCVA_17150, partial [Gammaproteobacteria bacterium]